MQPPQPFANPFGTVKTPAPVSGYINTRKSKDNVYYDGGSPVNPNQKAGGFASRNVGCASAATTSQDMLDAVGEPRLPKGYNAINSGHPTQPRRGRR